MHHLIVGLGNPGEEYRLTPHNLGFLTIDRLAADAGIRVTRPECGSAVGSGEIDGRGVVLAKPLEYMNRSGGPVKLLTEKYETPAERVLVVFDELALPWGALRLRPQGSAGGHKGMESVLAALGTDDVPRLRLGIHPGRPVGDGARYVLRPFRREELEGLDEILSQAAEAVRLFLCEGAAKAMTVVNRRAGGSTQRTE